MTAVNNPIKPIELKDNTVDESKIAGAGEAKPTTVAPAVLANKPTSPTKPWEPAKILEVAKKPNFRRKWVREDLVERFQDEHWILVDNKKKTISTPKTVVDGVPLSTAVRKRELVLMEIPEAIAKERDAYFKSLSDGALSGSVQEFKKIANEGSGKSYGEVIIRGGE